MKSSNSVIAYLLVIMEEKEMLLKDEENTNRKCPLCGFSLATTCELNLCSECIKSADCCVGLEKIRE
jgi:hypothetical protein